LVKQKKKVVNALSVEDEFSAFGLTSRMTLFTACHMSSHFR
jgi:hypothetical protein